MDRVEFSWQSRNNLAELLNVSRVTLNDGKVERNLATPPENK